MNLPELGPIVLGYHGTSSEAADKIVRDGFLVSDNDYDWLGRGVYFFQDAPGRAWEWAHQNYKDDPAVITAEIHLANCMDLLDVSWNRVLSDAYDSYLNLLRQSGSSPPTQSGGAHPLDRAVINYTVGVLEEAGIRIDCVRAAFREGRPVYQDSALYDRAHVQIAVRDTASCIKRIGRECGA